MTILMMGSHHADKGLALTTWAIGIDIGGTFTDVVALDYSEGALHSLKVLTTHGDPAQGVADGVRQLMQTCGIRPGSVARVVHATTLFTNALIERRGSTTGLLTTRGFRDVLEIGHERAGVGEVLAGAEPGAKGGGIDGDEAHGALLLFPQRQRPARGAERRVSPLQTVGRPEG